MVQMESAQRKKKWVAIKHLWHSLFYGFILTVKTVSIAHSISSGKGGN